MNNPRPLMSMRKTVQLMVILTLLAWATQTLFAQWGYGGLMLPAPAGSSSQSPSFGRAPAPAPSPARYGRANGATIELQPRARFAGEGTITLRDLCRWSDADAAVMEPLAGIMIARIGNAPRVRAVSVDDIKSRLHDAGANLSLLHFTGAAQCAVLVGDEANGAEFPLEPELATPAPVADPAEIPPVAGASPTTQPGIDASEEPAVIHYDEQLVLTRPLSRGQRIIASDIRVKRTAVDAPTTRPAIAADDVVGNVASRDMKKGDVFAPGDISRPDVVTKGQFMTVAMRIGRFEVETVARAMDSAAAGEICRAKNEASGEVYRVLVTAPNEGRVEPETSGDVAVVPQQ